MSRPTFWRRDIGVNVIPADTRKKLPNIQWKQYQDGPIPDWQHKLWIKAFSKGMAVIPGRVWHRKDMIGQYLICIDADKQNAIERALYPKWKNNFIAGASSKVLSRAHKDNADKAHIYFYSPIPFPKKSSDSILGLEVKGLGERGIMFCSPSIHKDGHPYEIIGTVEPTALNVSPGKGVNPASRPDMHQVWNYILGESEWA